MLRYFSGYAKGEDPNRVSILVLMEAFRRASLKKISEANQQVSILVIVEALQ